MREGNGWRRKKRSLLAKGVSCGARSRTEPLSLQPVVCSYITFSSLGQFCWFIFSGAPSSNYEQCHRRLVKDETPLPYQDLMR